MGWDGLSFCFYLSAGSRAGVPTVRPTDGGGGNVEAVRSGKKVCKMVVQ